MTPVHAMNRRQFVTKSSAAVTTLALLSSTKAGAAHERVVLGVMGLGGRGSWLAQAFARRPDVEIAYLCDADQRRFGYAREIVEKAQGKPAKLVQDFRRILDDPGVDAMIIATPDHWHGPATILACQAGKDVYVEKPLAHNIWEGRQMVAAARKHQRVVQVGTQSRSSPYLQDAAEWIRSGKLGDVHFVRVFNMMQHPRRKPPTERPVPEGLDYELWCGPAPKLPYAPDRSWLDCSEYSCGAIPGDAVHQLDLARYLIGDPPCPGSVYHAGGIVALTDGRDLPDTQIVTYEYGKLTMILEAALWTPYLKKTPGELRDVDEYPNWPFNATRIEVLGTRGFMYFGRHGDGWQVFDENGQLAGGAPGRQSDREHQDNFIQSVKTRARPNADVEIGHHSTLLCHLANISYRVGNKKLVFDAKSESFPDAPEANQHLKRAYRAPWGLPESV